MLRVRRGRAHAVGGAAPAHDRQTRRSPPHGKPGRNGDGVSQRQLRVGEEMRHVLADLLRQGGLRDPALVDANITVTEVRVSPDLRNATVFVMPLAGAQQAEILAGLGRSAGYLKARAGSELALRRIPNLTFALDQAFDAAERIAAVLARPEVARDLAADADADGADEDGDGG